MNDKGLRQAYQIRDIASAMATELKDTAANDLESRAARAQALRNLAQVWDTASERIRIIRGRPLPGSLRPANKPARPRGSKISGDGIIEYPAAGCEHTTSTQTSEAPAKQVGEQ